MAEQSSSDELPVLNIVGEHVALGPIRRELLPTYQRWWNDLATLRNLPQPPRPVTLEHEQYWFEHAIAAGPEAIDFTIYERATGRAIGNVDLHRIDYRNRTASTGIVIGEPDARGRGYGTEAMRLMLDYAFTALGLHNVMLRVFAYNLAGIRAYEKAGFREIGRRREAHLMGGRRWDEVFMDCLATGFASPVLGKVLVPDEPRSSAGGG